MSHRDAIHRMTTALVPETDLFVIEPHKPELKLLPSRPAAGYGPDVRGWAAMETGDSRMVRWNKSGLGWSEQIEFLTLGPGHFELARRSRHRETTRFLWLSVEGEQPRSLLFCSSVPTQCYFLTPSLCDEIDRSLVEKNFSNRPLHQRMQSHFHLDVEELLRVKKTYQSQATLTGREPVVVADSVLTIDFQTILKHPIGITPARQIVNLCLNMVHHP